MKFFSSSHLLILLGVVLVLLPTHSDGFMPKQQQQQQQQGVLSLRRRDLRCSSSDSKVILETVLSTSGGGGSGKSEEPTAGGGSHRWKRIGRHVAPVSTAVVIGSFSVLEILESSREMIQKWHVQHWRGAHGITLLALIRLARSIAILQTQAEELDEQVEELTKQEKGEGEGIFHTIQSSISRVITSPITAIVACVMAAVASVVEIVEDMAPGAHHGAALLALSEMYYQIRRFGYVTNVGESIDQKKKASRLAPVFKFPLGIPIALAAAAFAAIELVEDFSPGHHHGVAILALAELVENINRSKVLRF